MRESRVINVLAGLVTLGALAVIYGSVPGRVSPSMNPKPYEAVGWMAARQALSLLKPGGQISVITRNTENFKNPASDIQMASFKRTLRKARVPITSVLALDVDPLRPMEVPRGDFLELIREKPPGSVIVSFMGPPQLTEEQKNQVGAKRPSIVAFCPGSIPDPIGLQALLEQGFVQTAILSRRSTLRSTQSKDLQGWFDGSFICVTSANAESVVPASTAGSAAR